MRVLDRGKSGRVLMLTDAKHRSVQSRVELEPTAGATIELTIDRVIQHIAERELRLAAEIDRGVTLAQIAELKKWEQR